MKSSPISTSDGSHACFTRIHFEINYAIDIRCIATSAEVFQSKCNFWKNYNQINTKGWYNFRQTFYFTEVYIILLIFMQRPEIYNTFKCLRSYVIYDRYDELQLGRVESNKYSMYLCMYVKRFFLSCSVQLNKRLKTLHNYTDFSFYGEQDLTTKMFLIYNY